MEKKSSMSEEISRYFSTSVIDLCSSNSLNTFDRVQDGFSSPLPNAPELPQSSSFIYAKGPLKHKHLTSDSFNNDVEDTETEIYMSICLHQRKVGIAFYDVNTTVLSMLPDTDEDSEYRTIKQVVCEIQPLRLVVSSRIEPGLVQLFSPIADSSVEEDNGMTNEFLQFLPSTEYSYDLARRRLHEVAMPSIPTYLSEQERALYLASMMPADTPLMIRAGGALLKYLEKKRVGVELEAITASVPVLDVRIFTPQDYMFIDECSLKALQIFWKVSHPSGFKQGCGTGDSSKEGLSLFSVVNTCRSKAGVQLLRSWFLRPLRCTRILDNRLDAVQLLSHPSHQDLSASSSAALKKLGNIRQVLAKMKQSEATGSHWSVLCKTMECLITLGELYAPLTSQLNIAARMQNVFSSQALYHVASWLHRIVDLDMMSGGRNRFIVKTGVDVDLDAKKATYNQLPDLLTQLAEAELERLKNIIEQCGLVYLPQVGYLLNIPIEGDTPTDLSQHGLTYKFAINGYAHYTNLTTTELNTRFGDMVYEIQDLETSIMYGLQESILDHRRVLIDAADLAAELDCLLALATAARDMNAVRPVFVKENIIEVIKGRHPLQELCHSPFVPNDTHSGPQKSRVAIITGPNASGKSVYLKQVGILTCMAQIGCFVPAKSMRLGPLDGLHTRVKSLESGSLHLSTFLIDINQVALAVAKATPHSLILLDEFGKGVDKIDGLALLTAVLRHFIDRGSNCPHLLVSTHYHQLTLNNLLPRSPLVHFQTLEVMRSSEGELIYLFQLVEGRAGRSYAIQVAKGAGLPSSVIERAQQLTKAMADTKTVITPDLTQTKDHCKKSEELAEFFINFDLENGELDTLLQAFKSCPS